MNPDASAIRAEKHALRELIQAKLAALEAAEVAEKSRAAVRRLPDVPEFQRARSVLAFVSMAGEVDTHELIRAGLREGRRVCVPWFDRQRREYATVEIRDFDRDLVPGHYGILEPREKRTEDRPCEVALVPGLAFDAKGHRLGRGKGYYDKLLAGYRGTKLALTFEVQVVACVPVWATDVAMDVVVTDQRVYRCRAESKMS